MVSSYYNIADFFNSVATAHPNIKAFTMGSLEDVDLKKHTQFPLAHLIVNDVVISSGKMTYDISLLVMDKTNDVVVESQGIDNSYTYDYTGTSDQNDIYNTSLETINDVYSYILRNPDALDYNIDGDATLTPFSERFDNLLCGWGADFSITVGNVNNICAIDPAGISYSIPSVSSADRSISASYAETASYALVAQTLIGSIESASWAATASYFSGSISTAITSDTASYAHTASFVRNALTASILAGTASHARSASLAQTARTASYIETASYANWALTASFAVSYSYNFVTQSNVESASFASSSLSSSYMLGRDVRGVVTSSISASYAETASYFSGSVSVDTSALLTTGSQNSSQSLNGLLNVSGALAFTGAFGTTVNNNLKIDPSASNVIVYTSRNSTFDSGSFIINANSLFYNTSTHTFANPAYRLNRLQVTPNFISFRNDVSGSSTQLTIGSSQTSSFTLTSNRAGTQSSFGVSPNGIALTGTMSLDGPVTLTGPVTASSIRATAGFTGSLDGTASFALTASYFSGSVTVDTRGFLTTGSYNTTQHVSGNLQISGNIVISNGDGDSFTTIFNNTDALRLQATSSTQRSTLTIAPDYINLFTQNTISAGGINVTPLGTVISNLTASIKGDLDGIARTASFAQTAQTASFVSGAISNLTDIYTTTTPISNMVTLTQAQYNTISASAPSGTVFFIV